MDNAEATRRNELDARLRYDKAVRALDTARAEYEAAGVAWQYAQRYVRENYQRQGKDGLDRQI